MQKISLDNIIEGISMLILEIGRHPESFPILTPGQEALLTLLSQKGRMPLKDLKTLLNINTFQMSRLLASVENYVEGHKQVPLILREVHSQDKRQWVISLSESGRKVLAEELRRRRERLKWIFEPLSKKEKATLISTVKKMVNIMRTGRQGFKPESSDV